MSLNLPGFEAPKVPSISGSTRHQRRCPPPSIPAHDLLRVIGGGSYGEVWLARNVMGTYRAVKVVYRDNFETERPYAREFSGIQKFEPVSRTHEGLVDILQVERNDHEGYFYYVMELADGVLEAGCPAPDPRCQMPDAGSLSRESTARHPASGIQHPASSIQNPVSPIQDTATSINPSTYSPKTIRAEISKRGRLPFDECLQLSLSLTAALGHLHKAGLVHRDIKPSNIIFVNGLPKLADIGLVTAVNEAESLVGTPGFIPGDGLGTPQADIYGLGKVMYEIATGKDAHSFPEPPTLLPELSDRSRLLELNEVIIRACEATAANRYQSAEEMHDDLVLLQTGGSVRRLRVMEKRFARARRIGAIAIASALVVGAVLLETVRTKAQTTQRLVRQYVDNGTQLMNEGDLFGSLLWFTEALKLDAGDLKHEEPHRIRIASVLSKCPKLLNVFSHGNYVYDANFSPDGAQLVTSSDDHTARIWDVESGKELLTLHHDGEVYHTVFSPDGRYLVTASDDKTARIWDAKTGAPVSPPLQHEGRVWDAVFSADRRTVATASGGKTVRLWTVPDGSPIGQPLNHKEEVVRVAFSPDGRLLASLDETDGLRLWDTSTGTCRFGPAQYRSSSFSGRIFSPDSSRFLVCHSWTVEVRGTGAGTPLFLTMTNLGFLANAEFSPDGRQIVAATDNGVAQVWDAATGKPSGKPSLLPSTGDNYFMNLAISPDGRHFVTGEGNASARVWSTLTGLPVTPVLKHILMVKQVRYSPDGRRVATFSCDQAARVWDLATEELVSSPERPFRLAGRRLISPDGQRLLKLDATSGVEVTDTTTGKSVFPPLKLAKPVSYVCFSDDGRTILTACESINARSSQQPDIYLWDSATGARLNREEMHHRYSVLCTAFSPDGHKLATGSRDFTARLWEARTGRPLGPPMRHDSQVVYVAFDPTGKLMMTVSLDNVARVWDADSGKPITAPLKHTKPLKQAFFSHDGKRVHTLNEEDQLQVWDIARSEALTPPLEVREGSTNAVPAEFSLAIDRRPVEDLLLLAQMMAVGRLDANATKVPIALDELTRAWQFLRGKYPEQFTATPAEIVAWHRREAGLSESEGNMAAALFHLNRALEKRSQDPALAQEHAEVAAALAQDNERSTNRPVRFLRIPPRNPKAGAEQIDLSHHYNLGLNDSLSQRSDGEDLADLPSGLQTFGGVNFDVRGLVYLSGLESRRTGLVNPERVTNIRVGRRCRTLHFLHAAEWGDEAGIGKQIGTYVLHYDDGQTVDLPLRAGRDVGDWRFVSTPAWSSEPNAAVPVWTGSNHAMTAWNCSICVYKSTRSNPRPDVELVSIDFVSAMSRASPFLIALTVK